MTENRWCVDNSPLQLPFWSIFWHFIYCFLLELGQLILFSFEEFFFWGSNTLDLVLFFLPWERVQLTLVYFDELIDIVQLFFDKLELLVKVRRISFVGLRQLGFIKYFIDCFTQLVKLIPVLFVLELKSYDHFLVVFLAFPLLWHEPFGLVLIFPHELIHVVCE